jgi:phosphotriesterase-related protein
MTDPWPAGTAMTTAGPVPASALGLTSMHEHVLCDVGSYRTEEAEVVSKMGGADLAFDLANRGFLAEQGFFLSADNCRLDDRAAMTSELAELRATGAATILELSCPGLRTDVAGVRDIAAAAGMNVVVSTGLYIEPSWPPELAAMEEAALEAFMVAEIEEGIGATGVRAGHIGEIGVTDLGPGQARVLRAAARAAVRTGVAVTVHPGWDPSSDGRKILPLLTAEGLPPERVVLAHADAFFVEHDRRRLIRDPRTRRFQIDYHAEVLDAGANISVDCFGHDWNIAPSNWVIESDVDRLTGLVALVEAGYAAQIVLGTDICFKLLTRRGGGLGYRHLTATILPLLQTLGLKEKDITTMTTHTPAAILSRAKT